MFGLISCWYFETCYLVLLSFGFELSMSVIVNSEVGGLSSVWIGVCVFGFFFFFGSPAPIHRSWDMSSTNNSDFINQQ